MGTYSTSEFKKGLKVLLDGEPYLVADYDFRKPGKGQAVYTLRLKNLLRGTILEKSYRSGDKVESADVTETDLQYLYNDAKNWVFMDDETYEQYEVPKEVLDGNDKWLKEETKVTVVLWDGRPITVNPPNHVVLEVTYCEPGAKGNTATNVMKPATLETGAEIHVPIFINIGDKLRVDTRTGDYVERCNK